MLRVALSVRGARVQVVDRLTPTAQAGGGRTMRVIKAQRARRCTVETNELGLFSPKRQPKRKKKDQKVYTPVIERKQHRRHMTTKAKKKAPSEEASDQ